MCFCCRHSSIWDLIVRIFGVKAMECMRAQTRPLYTVIQKGFLFFFFFSFLVVFFFKGGGGVESEPMLTPGGNPLSEERIVNKSQQNYDDRPFNYSSRNPRQSVQKYVHIHVDVCVYRQTPLGQRIKINVAPPPQLTGNPSPQRVCATQRYTTCTLLGAGEEGGGEDGGWGGGMRVT